MISAKASRCAVSGRIDRPIVRQTFGQMLRNAGYQALESPGGREGLDLCRREPVDLVVMDWSMPELAGQDLLDALKAVHPQLKVIVCSGYAVNPGKLVGCTALLAKPVSGTALKQTVRRALDLRS